jgi:hypothetical protein
VMSAPSVEPGTTPDTQSAAVDQSPDRPVIQYCDVMTLPPSGCSMSHWSRESRGIRLRCVTQPDPAQAALLDRLGIILPKRMRLAEHKLPAFARSA